MILRALAVTTMALAAAGLYQEPLRPRFHFTPPQNFMNDPNGLVFADGEYHLSTSTTRSDRSGVRELGHAVSPDMVHWKHLPIALREERHHDLSAASCPIPSTSGLCEPPAPGRSCLVAIYTGTARASRRRTSPPAPTAAALEEILRQSVVDFGLKDFRDPKVFWHAPTRRWVMVSVLPDVHKVRSSARPT